MAPVDIRDTDQIRALLTNRRVSPTGEPPCGELLGYVVHYMLGLGHGLPPGDFYRQLIALCFKADPWNSSRIARGFPLTMLTVSLVRDGNNGLKEAEKLWNIYQSRGL